jgi:spermidine synthase
MSAVTSLKDKFSTLASFLSPVTVLRSSSPFNPDIRVVRNFGENELFVNDVRQSAGRIDTLWNQAFRIVGKSLAGDPESFLVFGVGGGSAMKLIRKHFPDAAIDVVDIDPEIIRIGKRYFGLERIGIRKFYCSDAQKFRPDGKYGFIIIDIYIGIHVPDFVLTETFLRNVKGMLKAHGHLLINYYDETDRHNEKTLQKLLERIYPTVESYPVYANIMLLASV